MTLSGHAYTVSHLGLRGGEFLRGGGDEKFLDTLRLKFSLQQRRQSYDALRARSPVGQRTWVAPRLTAAGYLKTTVLLQAQVAAALV